MIAYFLANGRLKILRSRFTICRAQNLGGFPNGSHDVLVSGATTEIPADRFSNLIVAGIGIFLQERFGSEQNSRRAKTALQSVQLPELLLQRMQLGGAWRKPFDGF
jgi:hypothetical protein